MFNFSSQDGSLFDRVVATLEHDRFVPDPNFPERLLPPFHSKGFNTEGGSNSFDDSKKQISSAERFCTKLYNETQESAEQVHRLDCAYAELLVCHFNPAWPDSPFRNDEPSKVVTNIARQAAKLLARLPAVPFNLLDLEGEPERSSDFPTNHLGSSICSWTQQNIVSRLSINTIRVAICVTIHPNGAKGKLSEFINHTAVLIECATRLCSRSKLALRTYKWALVRAFLWSSWQRATMIYFSTFLAEYIESGVYLSGYDFWSSLRSFSPLPNLNIKEMSKKYASRGKSSYMCSWAFELLRNEPACMVMDFRKLHMLYSKQFGDRAARCIQNSEATCKGDGPQSCNRFVGRTVKDQSAHDRGCRGCRILVWDEDSYRSIRGARAVSIEVTSGTRIRYQAASGTTLAISHVWSHGQGGRPETGMNACLHERYKHIASAMGCDSYWMDTPCIPTDHLLRRDAIMNINKIFTESKATLVCDQDLMEIEIPEKISVELRETILITTILCDWNARAWTFLEAIRGRQSIYLLCKNNAIISLREIVKIVHHHGTLDIAVLPLTVPHLLPFLRMKEEPSLGTPKKYPEVWAFAQRSRPLDRGFLELETGAHFLSHRPASRPGDDIVIWSLLLEEKVYENAIDLWRSRQDHMIHTSFLVSTAPRVGIWRFGWAPLSPNVFSGSSLTQTRISSMGFENAKSTQNWGLGEITPEGLRASWLLYKIDRKDKLATRMPFGGHILPFSNVRSILKVHLRGYRSGALLRASDRDGSPIPNREDSSKILVVVCGQNLVSDTNDDQKTWEWRGVHEWDLREALPEFTYTEKILLV